MKTIQIALAKLKRAYTRWQIRRVTGGEAISSNDNSITVRMGDKTIVFHAVD
jgi:hypothetical protein